jgi:Ca2+-binding RTX toxin-like protein
VQDYENETFTAYRPVINSGTNTGILEFESYARSVSMNIKSFDGRPYNDTGIVELIRDGEVIKTYSLNDYLKTIPSGSQGVDLTFESDLYFNEVRVSNTSTNDQFKVENVTLVSPYLVTYNIDVSAELTDESEILSNLILKVPSSLDGVLVVNGFAPLAALSADGAYNYYSIPSSTENVQMKFDFPEEPLDVELDAIEGGISDIIGSATSWESGDGYALSATTGDDLIAGTSDDNDIFGDDGDDVIFGGAGADILNGGEGNDTLVGEDGNDAISGGAGADAIYGGTGDDYIDGDVGNDYIDGGAGADIVYGGDGNETIAYDSADIEIDGGTGYDTLIGNSEVINLANVSNIEVIELNSGTSVVGSGVLGINASDVISATESGTLIIQSADGSSLNQVNVDETSFTQGADVSIDGIDYAQYIGTFGDDTATLLIELNDNIIVD